MRGVSAEVSAEVSGGQDVRGRGSNLAVAPAALAAAAGSSLEELVHDGQHEGQGLARSRLRH